MADVRHYADNLNYACVIPVNSEAFSDRIVSAKKRARRALVQDANVRTAEAILISKIPAYQHRNAQSPEVVRHHDGNIARRAAGALRLGQVRAVIPCAGIEAGHRRNTDGTSGDN